jgi:glycine/D-amino acid oxidase-like deaminating enzyme
MMALPVGESLAAIMCGAPPEIDLGAFSPLRFATGVLDPESVFI